MSRRLPIILLTHEYAPFVGGAATYVREIAAAAGHLGIDAEVWAPDRGQPHTAAVAGVVRLPCSGRLGPGVAGLMLQLFRRRCALRERPVILLSVGAHMAWAALHAAGVLPAARVTAFFHGSEIGKFERSQWWGSLLPGLYARVRGYAAASEYVSEIVRGSRLTTPRLSLVMATCAVPTDLQRAAAESHPSARGGPFRILTVARLHERKGQAEMAMALGRLPAELRAALVYQMVGVGEEDYRRHVEQACREAGIAWEFSGALAPPELAEAYRACDLYAQSSRTLPRSVEGFGISYLEAGAFGKPAVGVRTGGVGQAVIDGRTGFLAAEGESGALAAAVRRLMEDDALRAEMGEAARQHAASFSWAKSAAALCAFAAGS